MSIKIPERREENKGEKKREEDINFRILSTAIIDPRWFCVLTPLEPICCYDLSEDRRGAEWRGTRGEQRRGQTNREKILILTSYACHTVILKSKSGT
jgi:hypothetical protein